MRKITGIWDLARSGGSLGTLLILLQELEIQRQIHGADAADVVIVGDSAHLIDETSRDQSGVPGRSWPSDSPRLASMLAVLRAMSGVASSHVCVDPTAIQDAKRLMTTNGFYWPSPEALVQGKYNYDSTREIQNHYSQAGTMPRLSLDTRTLDWAKSYLKAKSRGRLPVAVHLKNNPNVRGESNADMDSWFAFISECQGKHAAHFILVGDDPVDARLRSLSNVTVARDDKASLDGYLALIQIAGLFMGMMSGPANMALFGTNPYLIFKNPDHHVREMAIELGENDHYPFALPHQRVLRVWDTAENLASAFESVFDQVAALKFTKIIERHL